MTAKVSAIKNDEELNRQITAALGKDGTPAQVREIRLLIKDLLQEVVVECRNISQGATNAINDVLKAD